MPESPLRVEGLHELEANDYYGREYEQSFPGVKHSQDEGLKSNKRQRMLSKSPVRRNRFDVCPPLSSIERKQLSVPGPKLHHDPNLLVCAKCSKASDACVFDRPNDSDILKALHTIESLSSNVSALTISISTLRNAKADFDLIQMISRRLANQFCAAQGAESSGRPAGSPKKSDNKRNRSRARSVPDVINLIDSAAEQFGLDLRKGSEPGKDGAHDEWKPEIDIVSSQEICPHGTDSSDGRGSPDSDAYSTETESAPYTGPSDTMAQSFTRAYEPDGRSPMASEELSRQPGVQSRPLSMTPPFSLRRFRSVPLSTTPAKKSPPLQLHMSELLAQPLPKSLFRSRLDTFAPRLSSLDRARPYDYRIRNDRGVRCTSSEPANVEFDLQPTYLPRHRHQDGRGAEDHTTEDAETWQEEPAQGTGWHTPPSTPPSPPPRPPPILSLKSGSPPKSSPLSSPHLRKKQRPAGKRVAGAVERIEKREAIDTLHAWKGGDVESETAGLWSTGVDSSAAGKSGTPTRVFVRERRKSGY